MVHRLRAALGCRAESRSLACLPFTGRRQPRRAENPCGGGGSPPDLDPPGCLCSVDTSLKQLQPALASLLSQRHASTMLERRPALTRSRRGQTLRRALRGSRLQPHSSKRTPPAVNAAEDFITISPSTNPMMSSERNAPSGYSNDSDIAVTIRALLHSKIFFRYT
jgi:hypothetical protein